jgi:hypothetical protein
LNGVAWGHLAGLAAPAGLSLYDAAKQSDVGAVEALLSNGKKPNDPNQCGPSYRVRAASQSASQPPHRRSPQPLSLDLRDVALRPSNSFDLDA